MSIDEETISFLSYLSNRKNKIEVELEPYYELLELREKAMMNTYGLETPKEKVLFKEYAIINSLEVELKKISNLRELEHSLDEQLNKCFDSDLKSKLLAKKEIIQEYNLYISENKDKNNDKSF